MEPLSNLKKEQLVEKNHARRLSKCRNKNAELEKLLAKKLNAISSNDSKNVKTDKKSTYREGHSDFTIEHEL